MNDQVSQNKQEETPQHMARARRRTVTQVNSNTDIVLVFQSPKDADDLGL